MERKLDHDILSLGNHLGVERGSDRKQNTELAHKVFLILNEGQLHRALLVEPKVALDLGCGSGIWALEFGNP